MELSELEEETLAKGRNYEHSKGAIHNCKLEALFNIFDTWKRVKGMLADKLQRQVCLFSLSLIFT